MVVSDPFSLNQEATVLNIDQVNVVENLDSFFAYTGPLSANTLYRVAISQSVDTSANLVVPRVPEPASLMLFGTSLLGLGVIGLRRRRKTAA